MEVIRHGKYKSAVEPFLDNKMSDNNRLQISQLLNAMWSVIATDISKSRNISVDKVNEIATNIGGRNAQLAKNNGLVDDILYRDEFEKIICDKTGSKSIDKVDFINIEESRLQYFKNAQKTGKLDRAIEAYKIYKKNKQKVILCP